MSTWFEGTSEISCDMAHVERALRNHGEHFEGVISFMPGLTSVELIDAGPDSVTIRTNEGVMERSNISTRIEQDRLIVESDERYQAGSRITVSSHFTNEFVPSSSGVTHRMVIEAVDAPGVMGFFYRRFGSSRIGKALLESYKSYLEVRTS